MQKKIVEQQLYSLSKLFTERLYRIPDYQRGYAWTEKQLKDFWSDLEQLEKGKNHYLGVLTLEQVPKYIYEQWKDDYWILDSKNYCPYYIVDGQQRLTTVIILVQAIIESVRDSNKRLNYNSLDEIRKRFIYESKDEGISRSYIFGYEKDNPSYEFLKTNIFMEASDSGEIPQQTIYTHNLNFAKYFFSKQLEVLSIEDKEVIYQKLTQSLLFNTYTISSEIDVFVAFETMNNRGKPLSKLELLKNRLIYLSTKFEVEDCEKEKLRTSINDAWKKIYHYLGKNQDNPLEDDTFLNNHFLVYFDKILSLDDKENVLSTETINGRILNIRRRLDPITYLLEKKFTVKSIINSTNNNCINDKKNKEEKNVGESFNDNDFRKETLTLIEIYDYVNSLKSDVELWYRILNPNDSNFTSEEKDWINKLIRLSPRRDVFPEAPLVMVFFQKEKKEKERLKLLKVLEGLAFMQLLTRGKISLFYVEDERKRIDMKEQALKLRKHVLSPEKLIKELEDFRSKIINSKDLLVSVKNDFKKGGFYKWYGIRYFLYEYDLYLQEKSKTNRQKVDWKEFNQYDYKSIEHIYPQNPRKECWTSKFSYYSDKERNILRHSLGNLLPLSKQKNSSFQNSCFQNNYINVETLRITSLCCELEKALTSASRWDMWCILCWCFLVRCNFLNWGVWCILSFGLHCFY